VEEEENISKSKRGFASHPELINRGGRPLGTRNKIPSEEDFLDAIKGCRTEVIQKIVGIMRRSADDKTQLKAAVKLLDANYQLLLDEDELTLKKNKKKDSNGAQPKTQVCKVINLRGEQ